MKTLSLKLDDYIFLNTENLIKENISILLDI